MARFDLMADRGSVLPAVLGLALGGLLLIGVVTDLSRWASSHREAAYVADAGAQAGAAVVSPEDLRVGMIVVDPEDAEPVAREVALSSRSRVGRVVAVTISDNQVCVTIEQPFASPLLGTLGLTPGVVRGSSCAEPARG